jgi:hypothetical protein
LAVSSGAPPTHVIQGNSGASSTSTSAPSFSPLPLREGRAAPAPGTRVHRRPQQA